VRHPERVSRLVLYGGFVQGVVKRSRTPEQLQETTMVMRGIPLGWGHDNPAFRMFFAARFLPEGTPEQIRWFSDLQRVATTPEMGARLLDVAAMIDVSDLVSQVRVPTLVLHVTGDAVASFNQGRKLAAMIPGARFVPLEGRNHILLEHEPAWSRFTEEVRRFLAEDRMTPPARNGTRGGALTAAESARPTRGARPPRGRSR
jgi:pimeloyl-ACP methyl ester carboxylesterase